MAKPRPNGVGTPGGAKGGAYAKPDARFVTNAPSDGSVGTFETDGADTINKGKKPWQNGRSRG